MEKIGSPALSLSRQALLCRRTKRPWVDRVNPVAAAHSVSPTCSRPFFTSSYRRSSNATASASSDVPSDPQATQQARLIPTSASYFTGNPALEDNLLALRSLVRKYQTSPVLKAGEAPRVAWQTLGEFQSSIGEQVKSTKYRRILHMLNRLNHIHPSLMPAEVSGSLEHFKRSFNPFTIERKEQALDEDGRAVGVGRRKSSSARVWLVEGEGEVLVNGKTLTGAFPRIHDRESAVWPLIATKRADRYNVWALVKGGGLTGQAEAITLGVAKALLVHEPLLKPALRRANLGSVDSCIGTTAETCSDRTMGKLQNSDCNCGGGRKWLTCDTLMIVRRAAADTGNLPWRQDAKDFRSCITGYRNDHANGHIPDIDPNNRTDQTNGRVSKRRPDRPCSGSTAALGEPKLANAISSEAQERLFPGVVPRGRLSRHGSTQGKAE
ncbi:MAG: 37S ribosomal protein S9, mitochondrial [Caeruleum heppii]|nr:MAG: 37S ribosomal protein S9, mitochondrial [Caeruleum heppii]